MAPKTAKRAATASSPRRAKKPRGDSVGDKCKNVVRAVEELALELPESVRKMLGTSAPNCLTIMAADRDEVQTAVVGMIGQALEGISTRLQGDVAKMQEPVDSAEQDRAGLDSAVTAAETELKGLQENATAAKLALGAATEALKEAKLAVSTAESEQEKGDASLVAAEGKKSELEAALNDTYNPLKEKAAKGKDVVNTLAKLGKKYKFEETLLSAMGTAFMKEPADRGSFDLMVFGQYETTLKERIDTFTKELEEGDAGRTARQGAVDAAKATATGAEGALDGAKATAAEAANAEKAGKAALQVAKKAVSDFWPQLEAKMGELDKVKATFTSFRDGPFAGYQDLKELAPAPAEPEAEAEAEAAVPQE